MGNKVTLITGTSKGIGSFLAQYYLEKGYIVIGCSRSNPKWENNYGDRYVHFNVDVSDEREVKKIFIFIRKTYGQLDYLINNAGIAAMNHSVLTPMEIVDNVFNTNTKGTFLFSREAFKLMKKKKFGRIVNFATVAVPLKLDGEAVYAASKAAVVSLTQIMAKEFASEGITVNAIGPTPVKTDLIKNVPEDKIKSLLNMQSVHRFGTFDDVANVIDFFISDKSDFVTGQVIYLGGL